MRKISIPLRRLILVVLSLAGWFWTQSLIGERTAPEIAITDRIHNVSSPLHDFLFSHKAFTNGLLISSSLIIDAIGMSLLLLAIFGSTIRPFLSLFITFVLRQICQGLTALPTPPGMIWHDPGFPSFLVTYGVSNDLFFSGHTAIATLGAIELIRRRRPVFTALGLIIVLFEVSTVLALRAHYFIDVYAGAVTAILIALVAENVAPTVDQWLGKSQDERLKEGM